jgi:transposase
VPRRSPFIIELTSIERTHLETAARQYTSPYRDVVRAKIILFAAEGLSNDVIASRLDMPRQIVSKWRKRFFKDRLMGLEEQVRSGRPVRFSPQRGGRR